MTIQLSEIINNSQLPVLGSVEKIISSHASYQDWIQFDDRYASLDAGRKIQSMKSKGGRVMNPATNVSTRPTMLASGLAGYPAGEFSSDAELNSANSMGLAGALTLALVIKPGADTAYRSLVAFNGPADGAKPYLQYNIDFPQHRLLWGNGVAATLQLNIPIGSWSVAMLGLSQAAVSCWTPGGGRISAALPAGSAHDVSAQFFSIAGLANQTGAFRSKATFSDIILFNDDVSGDANLQALLLDFAQIYGFNY